MGAIFLACLLSAAIGLLASGYRSVLGWIAASSLLLAITTISGFALGASVATVLGWVVATVLSFNAGLVLGLVIRSRIVRPVPTKSLRNTLPDR